MSKITQNPKKRLPKLVLKGIISMGSIPKYVPILALLVSMINAEMRVGVALFEGNPNYTHQATSLFAEGLHNLGYIVADRSSTEKIMKELKYQNSGVAGHVHPFNTNCVDLQCRSKDNEIDGQQPEVHYPVDYLFVGNVSIVIDPYITYANSYVNIRMIDVRTGEVAWYVNAKDPRIFSLVLDMNNSVKYAVKSALKSFKRRAK